MTGTRKIIFFILTFLLGAQFIFSGYSKLDVIEQYEIELVSYGITDWFWAKYLARAVVIFEFVLGLLLLLQIKLNKKTLWISLGTLVFFTLFVLYQMKWGSMGSCGCFGELVELTPEQTLVKNGISILLLIAAFFTYTSNEWLPFQFRKWAVLLILFISITTVNIIFPPFDIYDQHTPEVLKEGATFPNVPSEENNLGQQVGIDSQWYSGKKLVVLVSSSCMYCQQVVTKINVAYDTDQHRDRVLLVFLDAKQGKINSFFYRTGGKKFEYTRINKSQFINITKGSFPQLFYLKDGKVVKNMGKKELFEATPDF